MISNIIGNQVSFRFSPDLNYFHVANMDVLLNLFLSIVFKVFPENCPVFPECVSQTRSESFRFWKQFTLFLKFSAFMYLLVSSTPSAQFDIYITAATPNSSSLLFPVFCKTNTTLSWSVSKSWLFNLIYITIFSSLSINIFCKTSRFM